MFLELFPFPIPSPGSTLIFGLRNVGLLSHTFSLWKSLGVLRSATREAKCPGPQDGCVSRRVLFSGPQEAAHLWMFEPACLCGCCGYLAWLWIQNFTCLLNACPRIPLRGPLPFLPSAIRANTWEIIRFQVVEWLGLVPSSYYPSHGHHWGR